MKLVVRIDDMNNIFWIRDFLNDLMVLDINFFYYNKFFL